MTQLVNLDQIIAEKVRTLAIEQQQQVMDFVDFLLSKTQKVEFKNSDGSPMSALEAAGDIVGCVEGGPGDLAINKEYLKGTVGK